MFVLASWLWTNVRFLGWKVGSYPVLEVDPGKVILKVTVGILGRGLELADWTDLDCILSRVSGDS